MNCLPQHKTRRKHLTKRERKQRKFNNNNDYWCSNIKQLESCPQPSTGGLLPIEENPVSFECNQYYDGCNS